MKIGSCLEPASQHVIRLNNNRYNVQMNSWDMSDTVFVMVEVGLRKLQE